MLTMAEIAEIGKRIREIREQKKLSRQQLASLAGISLSALYSYEKGNMVPGADVLARLAEVLSVSSDYLLNLTDDPTPRVRELPPHQLLLSIMETVPDDLRRLSQRLLEIADEIEKYVKG